MQNEPPETTTEAPETTPDEDTDNGPESPRTPDEDTDNGPESPPLQAFVAPAEEVGEPPELVTEYAIGSDGHLYVSEASFKPGAIEGREKFVGYQLTDEEAAAVWDEIHRQAFNVTMPLRSRRG